MAFVIFDAVKLSVKPSQIGAFEPAVGAAGIPFTCTAVAAVPLHPLASVTSIFNAFDAVGSVVSDVYVGFATDVLLSFVAPAPVHTYVYGVTPPVGVATIADVKPAQIVAGVAVAVTVGFANIVAVIVARGPSQPAALFCDTYRTNVPAAVVVGVGAVALAVPSVATVYHCKV